MPPFGLIKLPVKPIYAVIQKKKLSILLLLTGSQNFVISRYISSL